MITPTQMRAARAILDISQAEASKLLGIAPNTLSKIESGQADPPASRIQEIQSYYESQGIEFIDGDGARKYQASVRRYSGTEGLTTLMDDIYETAKTVGGEICLYNAKPENWLKYLSVSWFKMHAERMVEVRDNYRMRILAEENNKKLISSFYAIHRWFPKELFISERECLYVYGDKLGFVNFGTEDVEILILQSKQFSVGVRALFNIAWDHVGIMPPFGEKLAEVDFSEWENGK
jgi:transcriptional regulator with XRE-family HTH domain